MGLKPQAGQKGGVTVLGVVVGRQRGEPRDGLPGQGGELGGDGLVEQGGAAVDGGLEPVLRAALSGGGKDAHRRASMFYICARSLCLVATRQATCRQ